MRHPRRTGYSRLESRKSSPRHSAHVLRCPCLTPRASGDFTQHACAHSEEHATNGKSKLLEIVRSVFPKGRVAALAPQSLCKEYWRAKLRGVLLNGVSEMPSATIMESDVFKAIVAGDIVDGREPTKSVFNFRPIAGHFFAANTLPGTTDQSFGFWRRFIVIGFNRNFEREGADKRIVESVLEDGHDGILTWLVDGAARLARRGSYTIPVSHDSLHTKWRGDSDSVAMWLQECVERADRPCSKGRELFKQYQSWASAGGYKPVAENKWGERMRRNGFEREGGDRLYPARIREAPGWLRIVTPTVAAPSDTSPA